MPRIKVFIADLGFYQTAVAARSQKMALAHWGVSRDLFREGSAKETQDPRAVQAAMRKVGLVVRRPIGASGPFKERGEAERTLLKKFSGKSSRQVKKGKGKLKAVRAKRSSPVRRKSARR
jgi:hypothetical protein